MFEKLLVNIKKAYSVVLFEQDFRNSILFLATYLQQEGSILLVTSPYYLCCGQTRLPETYITLQLKENQAANRYLNNL